MSVATTSDNVLAHAGGCTCRLAFSPFVHNCRATGAAGAVRAEPRPRDAASTTAQAWEQAGMPTPVVLSRAGKRWPTGAEILATTNEELLAQCHACLAQPAAQYKRDADAAQQLTEAAKKGAEPWQQPTRAGGPPGPGAGAAPMQEGRGAALVASSAAVAAAGMAATEVQPASLPMAPVLNVVPTAAVPAQPGMELDGGVPSVAEPSSAAPAPAAASSYMDLFDSLI